MRENRRDSCGPFRLGLLGGTFDPVHIGHLRLAIEAIEVFNLDEVRLVLSSIPPHKESKVVTDREKRWRMLELACSGNDKLIPSSLEIDRPGSSYTVDTLREVRSELHEGDELFLLLGADAAGEMISWKSYRSIFGLARVVAAPRAGDNENDIPNHYRDSIEFFDLGALDISSTRIRESVRKGKDISHLVPRPVHRYIMEKDLYREEEACDRASTRCGSPGEDSQ